MYGVWCNGYIVVYIWLLKAIRVNDFDGVHGADGWQQHTFIEML